MSTKQVTAQSIVDCFIGQYYDSRETHSERHGRLLKELDAILSQARQEARREGRMEGLKEMDDAWKRVLSNDQPESALMQKLRQEYNQV
jgi:hypothetical protein